MRASSRGRRRRDFEASIIIRATIAVGPSRPGCTGHCHSPASTSASRSAARSRTRAEGRICGFGGCRIALREDPVQAGKGPAYVSVAGVFGGDHQALPVSQPGGEPAAPGVQVLDPRASIRDVRPGGQCELGAPGVGDGRWFGRTERGEPLLRTGSSDTGPRALMAQDRACSGRARRSGPCGHPGRGGLPGPFGIDLVVPGQLGGRPRAGNRVGAFRETVNT